VPQLPKETHRGALTRKRGVFSGNGERSGDLQPFEANHATEGRAGKAEEGEGMKEQAAAIAKAEGRE
jgi:hypothetical protein